MYYYIINPAAGGGSFTKLQDKLRRQLSQLGIDGEFAKTTGPNDATKMAHAAIERGHTTIVAVGGDATIHEVINGITNEAVAVGIIPTGRLNTVASKLGIASWQQACELLAARRLSSYNLISIGPKVYLSPLNLNFSNQKADQDHHNNHSATPTPPLQCKLSIDSRYELKSPLYHLNVMNQKFENPSLDNKLVITLDSRPAQNSLRRRLTNIVRKKQPPANSITRVDADRLIIETTPPTSISTEDQLIGPTPVVIKLADKPIRFITEKAMNPKRHQANE